MMLRTNLATRPFYNERAVYLVLGLIAVVGLVVLSYEAIRIRELTTLTTTRTIETEASERAGAELSVLVAEVQRGISPEAIAEASAAAREANLLSDQRVFSWTDFFNRIETTLPADVMVTEVRPDIAPGSVEVTMGVLGRSLDAITEFIGALEDSGAFSQMLNPLAELTDDGMYSAVLRGTYLQASPADLDQAARAAAPPASAEARTEDADVEPDDGTRLADGDDELLAEDRDQDATEAGVEEAGADPGPVPTPPVPGGDPL